MTCENCKKRRELARKALLDAAMGITTTVKKIAKPAQKGKTTKKEKS